MAVSRHQSLEVLHSLSDTNLRVAPWAHIMRTKFFRVDLGAIYIWYTTENITVSLLAMGVIMIAMP